MLIINWQKKIFYLGFFKAVLARTVKTTTKILENFFWIYSTSTDHSH